MPSAGLGYGQGGADIVEVAKKLRNACLMPETYETRLRLLPLPAVFRCRFALCALASIKNDVSTKASIDEMTIERRIEMVMASKGIILKKLCQKLRCYVSVDALQSLLSGVVQSFRSRPEHAARRSVLGMRNMIRSVADYFVFTQEKFWAGDWSLSDTISSISSRLWADKIMMMLSEKHLCSWSLSPRAEGQLLTDTFSVSNHIKDMTQPRIEDALNGSSSKFPRTDLEICARALKDIEQW